MWNFCLRHSYHDLNQKVSNRCSKSPWPGGSARDARGGTESNEGQGITETHRMRSGRMKGEVGLEDRIIGRWDIEANRRGRKENSYCVPRMVSIGGGGNKEGDAEGEIGGGGGGREKKKSTSFKSLGACDQLVEACESLGWKTLNSI